MSPDPTTTNDRKQIPARLPAEQYDALKGFAFFTGQSMNEIISRALGEFLEGPARQEQLAAMLADTQTRYRTTLDKLKDL